MGRANAAAATRISVWSNGHNWLLLLTTAAILALPLVSTGLPRTLVWPAVATLLVVFIMVAGHGYNGLLRGALVDSQNRLSLSRLQLIAWTVLVLSGFMAMALWNIGRGDPDPLGVSIPEELWVLLGINTTSFVGTTLIQANKKNESTNHAELERSAHLLGVDHTQVRTQGQLVAKRSPKDASWSDLFEGEETGNWATLDLAKIQMFFFTLVLFVSYAAELVATFAGQAVVLHAFPPLTQSMVALLAISHGGYLANKAVPQTPRPPSS